MGKSAGRAPAAPDPSVVAQAQGQANIDAARYNARLNNVNSVSPFGSVTYRNVGEENAQRAADEAWKAHVAAGGTAENFNANNAWNAARGGNPDRYEQTTTFTPQVQGIIDRVLNTTGQGVDLSQGDLQRQRVEGALFQRLDPSLDLQRTGLETRLRNQGLVPGGEAWRNAMRDQGMAETDARLAVTAQGGQEQSRVLENMLRARQAPIQELSALLNGTQIPSGGGGGGGGVQPVDWQSLYGNQQAGQQAQYQARAQNAASGNAAAAGISAAAITAAGAIIA